MSKCINCDYLFSCERASEEIEECEDYIKTQRKIMKLESKKRK
jgi:hypothetical protein